jgi:O-antigen/teichoic acid export membrane protein
MKQDVKILVRHFITYGIGIYLTKLIGFFMIPIYTTYLTPADYGVLELLDLTLYVVGMIVSLGISNSIIRFYSDCDDKKDKSRVVTTAFFAILAMALFVNCLLILFSGPISRLIFHSGESTHSAVELSFFVRIVAVSGIMDMMSAAGVAYLQAEKKSSLFTAASIVRFIIAVSLNILFIVELKLGVLGVLYSQIISNFIFLTTVTLLARRRIRWDFSGNLAGKMIRYGAPLIISTLAMFIIHFSDRFFLERFVGLSILGVYSLSYKFALILPALFYAPFELIWNAQMFDLYKKGEEGRRTINYYNKYMLVFSLMFITPYSLCVKNLIFIMADPKFHEAYRVVPVLLLAFMFIGLASISSAGIFFVKKTIYRGLANIYGAVVALAGYYFLIQWLGYWGAVITTLLAFIVRYAALSIYSQRFYPLKYEPLLYLRLIIITAVTYIVGSTIIIDNNIISLLVRGGIGLALFVVLAIVLRVFSRYEISTFGSMIKNVVLKGLSRS